MVQDFRITFSPQFCILIAVFLFLFPLPWLLGWFAAAAVHEASHCLALSLCGKRINHIVVGVDGAQIQTESLTDGQTVLCSLAGPIGELLLLFAADLFPRLALCALMQSTYNLIPIYPLDGGRALRGLTNIFLKDRTSRYICHMVETVVTIGILYLCCIAAFAWKLGVLPLAIAVLFALRMKKIKIPCK